MYVLETSFWRAVFQFLGARGTGAHTVIFLRATIRTVDERV